MAAYGRSWPRTLWSWDISKLLGPAKWTYFYLYRGAPRLLRRHEEKEADMT